MSGVLCMFRLTSLGVSSVSLVCNEERVRAAVLINAWISVDPCCTVASVRKRLQASGIERGRRSVHEYMQAEHWPAKQVICVEIRAFLCHSCCFGPPTGEESALDGAEQAAPPEWCSSMLERLGEKKKPGSVSQDAHFSQIQ